MTFFFLARSEGGPESITPLRRCPRDETGLPPTAALKRTCRHFVNTYFPLALALWPQGAMLRDTGNVLPGPRLPPKRRRSEVPALPQSAALMPSVGIPTARAVCARVPHIRALLAAGTLHLSNK
jgi:hypothetical protein